MSTLDQLVAAGRHLVAARLAIGSLGNVSIRQDETIWITPTRVPYHVLEEDDLVAVDLDGRVVEGWRAPSSELALHLAIYCGRPDVGAIVHAHGPHAVAWSFLERPLEPAIEEAAYYGIGDVRVSRPAPAGSAELGVAGALALGAGKAALLARHGVVTVGADLDEALVIAEIVEHHATVACALRAMADR